MIRPVTILPRARSVPSFDAFSNWRFSYMFAPAATIECGLGGSVQPTESLARPSAAISVRRALSSYRGQQLECFRPPRRHSGAVDPVFQACRVCPRLPPRHRHQLPSPADFNGQKPRPHRGNSRIGQSVLRARRSPRRERGGGWRSPAVDAREHRRFCQPAQTVVTHRCLRRRA